ncbi:MAG: recombinase family protein [Gemmataceae bacterium]
MPTFPHGAAQRGTAAAAQVNSQLRRQHDAAVLPLILELREQGHSLAGIAFALEERGIRTRQGNVLWHPRQVLRILRRAAEDVTQSAPEAAQTVTASEAAALDEMIQNARDL